MLRSVQFPMVLLSENEYRRMDPRVRARKVKLQRAEVGLFLKQLPRVRLKLDGGVFNVFQVKIVRISAGEGLDRANLAGACKAAEDQVAEWIGLDDRDPHFRSEFRQQRCRMRSGRAGFYVRVEIRCHEPGASVIRVLGEAPAELGEEAEQCPPPLGPKTKRAPVPTSVQPRLPVKTAWKQVPWDKDEVEELPQFAGVDVPPATIRVAIPKDWHPPTLRGLTIEPGEAPTLTLFRTEYQHPEVGAIWLYIPAKPGMATQWTATR